MQRRPARALLPLLLLALGACTSAAGRAEDEVRPGDVRLDGRLVARAMTAYEPARAEETCKVFHMVWSPDGRLLTKAQGGDYPHHRGLFLGWNRVRLAADEKAPVWDFWHCRKGETLRLVRWVPATEHGKGPEWQVAEIAWRDGAGRHLVTELRGLRARKVDATTTALDLDVELRATTDEVLLDGDPHHAGVQFRALQRFAEKDQPKVSYLRPEGATDEGNDIWTHADWTAAVLPLEGGPVTVVHVDHPTNPRPNRYSSRPYGRFGSTFTARVHPQQPLQLRYTLVLAGADVDPAAAAASALHR